MKQLLLLFTFLMGLHDFVQPNIYQEILETFEVNNPGYFSSETVFTDEKRDYFIRTANSDISGGVEIYGVEDSTFYGVQHIDGEGAVLPITLTTAQIDITDPGDLELTALSAEDTPLVSALGKSNSEILTNKDFDILDETTLEIQVEFDLNAGDEDIALNSPGIINNSNLSARTFNKDDVHIYPNPVTNGRFWINHQLGNSLRLKIFSIQGKQVLSRVITQNESVNVSNLKSGIYLINLTADDYKATKKLIIK